MAQQGTERIPNKEEATAFPRWMPQTQLFLKSKPDAAPAMAFTGRADDIAVNGQGVVHVAGIGTLNQNLLPVILYTNNRYETRQVNGFAAPFIVRIHAGIPFQGFHEMKGVRIAIAPSGKIGILWLESRRQPDGATTFDLFVRELHPATGWDQSPRNLLQGVRVTPGLPADNLVYENPHLVYSPQNVPHIVIGRRAFRQDTFGNLTVDERAILHSVNFEAFSVVFLGSAHPSTPFPRDYPVFGDFGEVGPFVQVDPQNGVHIAWQNQVITSTESKSLIRYKPPTGDNVDVTGQIQGGWGFAAGTDGSAHFAYKEGENINYRARVGGSLGNPEAIPIEAGFTAHDPGLALDMRDRPIVAWTQREEAAFNQFAGFARKVDNSAFGTGFAVQAPLAAPGGFELHGGTEPTIRPACRVRSGGNQIHMFYPSSAREYTHTVEFNLGDQDAFTLYPAGPNATANVATGNLGVNLPLFNSRGAGFATSLALTYNTLDEEPGPLSRGWTHTYNLTLIRHSEQPEKKKATHTLRFGDGRQVVFKQDDDKNVLRGMDEFGYFAKLEVDKPEQDETLMTTKFKVEYVFRADGKLKEIKDTNNNKIRFEYGPNSSSSRSDDTLGQPENNLTQIIDTMGRQTTLTYGSNGSLSEVQDPAGGRYVLSYDSNKNLQRATFAAVANVAWRLDYHDNNDAAGGGFNRDGLLARMFTPRGNNQSYSYDFFYLRDSRLRVANAPATELVDESGSHTVSATRLLYSYIDRPPSSGPQVAEVTNRRDIKSTVEYEYKRCLAVKVTDGRNNSFQRSFDPEFKSRNLTKFADKKGVETDYSYYSPEESTPDFVADNLKTVIRKGGNDAPGQPQPPLLFTYTSDGGNRMASASNGRGNATTYIHDNRGNVQVIVHPPTVLADGTLQQAEEQFVYDNMGRVTHHKNAEQNVTEFRYTDGDTGLVTQILAPGAQSPELLQYDTMGSVRFHTPPGGGSTEFIYDGMYRVETIKDPSTITGQHVITSEYDEDSNLIKVFDTNSGQIPVTHNTFNILGMLIAVRNRHGDEATWQYDREGNARIARDFRGTETTRKFDELNRASEELRDGSGPTGTVTHRTLLDYDATGNLSKTTVKGNLDTPDQVTEYFYDVRNNLRRIVQPEGLEDTRTYDENDNLLVLTRLRAGVTVNESSHEYDERERLRLTTVSLFSSSQNLVSRFVYDRNNSQTEVTDAAGKRSRYVYDPRGRLRQSLSHAGTVLAETEYDDRNLRKLVRVQSPGGFGLTVAVSFEYNEKGELVARSDPAGNRPTYQYDSRGNLLQRTDAAGVVARFEYDLLDRVKFEHRAFGTPDQTTTEYDYDPNGNRTLIKVFNPATGSLNAEYRFEYDNANRLARMTYPGVVGLSGSALTEEWTYDPFGNIATHKDRNGKVARFTYDGLNHLTEEKHTSPQGIDLAVISRTYDGASNVLSVTDSVANVEVRYQKPDGSSGYDSANRLTDMQWIVGGTLFKRLRYEYDLSSNRTKVESYFGVTLLETLTYGYDDDNRLTTISRSPGNLNVTLEYDAGGRRRHVHLGVSSPGATAGAQVRIDYGYDLKERLSSLRTSREGQVRAHYVYAYDERDNRKTVDLIHMGVTIDYAYDAQNRLRSETWTAVSLAQPAEFQSANVLASISGGNESGNPVQAIGFWAGPVEATPRAPAAELQAVHTAEYKYDPAGNRTEKRTTGATTRLTNYRYDEQNRLVEEKHDCEPEPIRYEYNANGNQTTRIHGTSVETYGYDYANRLASYVRMVNGLRESFFVYAYMPTGERLNKQDLGSTPSRTEWYGYDGQDVLEDFEQDGSAALLLKRSYIQSLDIDSKFGRLTLNEDGSIAASHWYAQDALGSIHQVLNSQGTTVKMDLSDAWGEALPATAFTFANQTLDRHEFNQREKDGESGLMHFRSRAYDPRLGRFVQTDPVMLSRPSEHYVYARNNPLRNIDRFGRQPEDLEIHVRRATWTVAGAVSTDGDFGPVLGKEVANRLGGDGANVYGAVNLAEKNGKYIVTGFGLEGRGQVADLDLIKYKGQLKVGQTLDPSKIEWHVELSNSGRLSERKLANLIAITGKEPTKILKLPVKYRFARAMSGLMGKLAKQAGKAGGALAVFGGVITAAQFAEATESTEMRNYLGAVRRGRVTDQITFFASVQLVKDLGPAVTQNVDGMKSILTQLASDFQPIRTEMIEQLRAEYSNNQQILDLKGPIKNPKAPQLDDVRERQAEIVEDLGSLGAEP